MFVFSVSKNDNLSMNSGCSYERYNISKRKVEIALNKSSSKRLFFLKSSCIGVFLFDESIEFFRVKRNSKK
jgi:hypothetical protein